MRYIAIVLLMVISMQSTFALSKPQVEGSKYNSTKYAISYYSKGASFYKIYKLVNGKYKTYKALQKGWCFLPREKKDTYYKVVAYKGNNKKGTVVKCPKIKKRKVSAYKHIKNQIINGNEDVNLDGYSIDINDDNKIQEYIATNNTFYSTNRFSMHTFIGNEEECEFIGLELEGFKERKKEAKKVLDNLHFNGTDYQKLKQINNWIIDNATYSKYKYGDEPYGVAVKHKAKCTGYAETFQYLCTRHKIKCKCVVNDNHIWNIVKLDKWYIVDTTWNDNYYEHFNKKKYRYSFFLVSDKTHETKPSSISCSEDYRYKK